MSETAGSFSMTDFLTALTFEIHIQQARLDFDFDERIKAFKDVLVEASKNGTLHLALSVAPMQMVIMNVEVSARFRFTTEREEETKLKVSPINLGFSRRYAFSGYVENSLQVKVQRHNARQKGK